MKYQTIIIGQRSNLSQRLNKKIPNSKIVSSKKFLEDQNFFLKYKSKKLNIIINNFYPSYMIGQKIDLNIFLQNSIETIKKILNVYSTKNINKIIYSSSASVYNLPRIENRKHKYSNKEIFSLTKSLCENILMGFARDKKINLTIARIFNIYGGNDKFSIINKIINSYLNKKTLFVNNNGESTRDFIHVDEVCEIYRDLINNKNNLICDVGNGYGYKIKDIINAIGKNKFRIKNINITEQSSSIAQTDYKLKKNINLEKYIRINLNIKKKLAIDKITFKNYQLLIKKKIKGSIIYGAGNAGKQVCDLLLKNSKDAVYCFVDDDKKKVGKYYREKIIVSKEELQNLANHQKIPNIILAIPSLNGKKLKYLFSGLYKISSSVSNLPLKSELNTNIISLNDLQNSEFINIFEKKNLEIVKNYTSKLKNKNILITGAGGSIGSELVTQLSKVVNKKIICLDFSELFLFNLKNNLDLNQKKIRLVLGDINDQNLIKKIVKDNKIDLIFHSAAYKHLNFLEENPVQAIKNNILGTYNLINTVNSFTKKKIKIINISTDKAVIPSSILGLTKRVSEIICYSFKYDKYSKIDISTVRFGNVFGSRGSVINLFLEKLNKGENIDLTHKDAKRFFMSINEACNLVIAASQIEGKFKTFILDMGKPIKIKSLLEKMIFLKKKINKDFKIKINEVGLNRGEKLSEQLSINKNIKKTKINRVLEVNEPIYPSNEINRLISKIKQMVEFSSSKKIVLILKSFLKKELN